jgi:hypothetical protein
MNTFYSLIKIAPNPASGDNITIGIIVSDASGFRYRFSKSRIGIVKKLIGDTNGILAYIEKQISAKIDSENKSFFNDRLDTISRLTESYFNYLNNYCNGILQFSKPGKIFDSLNDEKFEKLYKLLVDKEGDEISALQSDKNNRISAFFSKVETRLIDRVSDKIHVKEKFNSDIIPSLLTPFEMDCIGKNGSLIGAKSISLEQSQQTIASHLNSYMNVIFHLSYKYAGNQPNNFYLIADEPTSVNSAEHDIWEKLRREDKFTLLQSDECDKIAVKIEEKRATKFL